ncbi:MAG: fibronectin type III domain-containing protein [Candidatus Levybacteria bacterium]|nr:fibronectin type III domain-containing protein [Candidatus Levybacteria bacterium]
MRFSFEDVSFSRFRLIKKVIFFQVIFVFFLLIFSSNPAFAAPTVSSITESTFSSAALSHAVSMPATVSTGDLLLVIFTNNGDATVTTPTGWVRLWSNANGTALRGTAYVRVSRGTEGGTTVDFVTSASEQAAAQVYRVTDWSGTLSGVVAGESGQVTTGSTADLPTLTPYFGQADTLWLGVMHTSTAQTVSSAPTNYTNLTQTSSSSSTSGAQAISSRRILDTATEDPGVYTMSGTGASKVYNTVAIAPSGTGPLYQQFNITQGSDTLWAGMYTSQSYSAIDTSINRAVIVVHGASNNAYDYYNYVSYNLRHETGVFLAAPSFIESADDPDTNQLYWTSVWSELGRSSSSLPFRISSGGVLDNFISQLYTSFPNLQGVVITGFSAGGQLVNRYSEASSDTRNRYLVGAPSSYAYTGPQRANGSGGFDVPVTVCTTYDDWKYGLQNLSTTQYVQNIGASALTTNLNNSIVTYMVGSLDTDPAHSSLDTDCEAEQQGDQRYSRMTNFYNFLGYKYGNGVYDRHTMSVISGVGHEASQILGSAEALSVMMQNFNRSVASTQTSSSSAPPTCTAPIPSGLPNLFQINTAKTSATLFFSPVSTASNYLISYGANNNISQYNVQTNQGSAAGVLSYTISALSPNTTYSFSVAAQNSCGTPGNSSTMTAKTGSNKLFYKNSGSQTGTLQNLKSAAKLKTASNAVSQKVQNVSVKPVIQSKSKPFENSNPKLSTPKKSCFLFICW